MENNRNKLIGLSIVGVLVIVGLIIYVAKHQTPNSISISNQTNNPADDANAGSGTVPGQAVQPGGASGSSVSVVTGPTTLNYGAAVTKYKDHRIQFDAACQASPKSLVFKNPATLMLDNRSAASAKLVIDKKTYTLAAYQYEVITLNEAASPSRSYIDCNTSQNVAQIVIEK